MGLKDLGKRVVKDALMKSGGLSLATRMAPAGAVVLMYHSIVENPETTRDSVGISQPRSSFEAHIRILAKSYNPVSIEQVVQFAHEGHPLPPKSVAVTFDDGFADNYDVALPILNRYRVPATFYIMVNAVETGNPPWYCRLRSAFGATRRLEWSDPEHPQTCSLATHEDQESALNTVFEIGARKTGETQEQFLQRVEKSLEVEPLGPRDKLMMTWDHVRALRKAGHIVGAHTLSHPNLAHVSGEEAKSEIVGSKKRLEEELGEPIDHFSYPHPALNPQWNPATLELTCEAGFKSAVLTKCGAVRAGDEPLALKRIYAANDLAQWVWNMECTFLGRSI
ncbi:MAG: polysaccharide deacetylase family protein [Terriglobia bacterium]